MLGIIIEGPVLSGKGRWQRSAEWVTHVGPDSTIDGRTRLPPGSGKIGSSRLIACWDSNQRSFGTTFRHHLILL